MQTNAIGPWHTHLGSRIFGIAKAADLFFGILIVVSALLLGQDLSNECQSKPPRKQFCTFSVFALRSWHWTEAPTDQYIQRCALLDSVANSACTKFLACNRLFFVCRNFSIWIFHNCRKKHIWSHYNFWAQVLCSQWHRYKYRLSVRLSWDSECPSIAGLDFWWCLWWNWSCAMDP